MLHVVVRAVLVTTLAGPTLAARALPAQQTPEAASRVTVGIAAGAFVRDFGEAPPEPLVLGRAAWALAPMLSIEAGLGATWLCSGASVGNCRGSRPFGMAELHLQWGRASGMWRPYLTAGGGIIGPLSDGETAGADPTASIGAGLRVELASQLTLRAEARGRADGGSPSGGDVTIGASWRP